MSFLSLSQSKNEICNPTWETKVNRINIFYRLMIDRKIYFSLIMLDLSVYGKREDFFVYFIFRISFCDSIMYKKQKIFCEDTRDL